MLIYILVFILINFYYFFIYINGNNKSLKKKKIFLFFSFLTMFLIMGFRSENVGTDTSLYCNIFIKNSTLSFMDILKSGDSAILYVLYNKLVSLFSNDRNAIIVINSFVICLLTAIFIYNNSKKNVILPTILFMSFYHYFSAMNISRQYIAVLLIANSLYFLKLNKKLPFIFMCICATFIHNTAIISFTLLPIFFIKRNKKKLYIYLFSLFVIALFLDKIIAIFSQIFPHYELYLNNNLLTEVGQNKKILITFIYIIFEIIILILLRKKTLKIEEENSLFIYYFINALAILIGILSLKIMLLSRIEVYFSIFAIIYIPYILSFFKDKILYIYIFTLLMILPMLIQLKSNNSEVLPDLVKLSV